MDLIYDKIAVGKKAFLPDCKAVRKRFSRKNDDFWKRFQLFLSSL